MDKIPSEERFSNGPYSKAFLLMLVLTQVTWPIRSIIAARRCNDACYRNTEMYCKVFYGGRVATCVKCEIPCSSHRQEDQRVCTEFCKDSQYHASTETPLEEHSPAERILEISTLSTLSDAPSTSVFTSEQLTTNLLSTSLETQNMTMVIFEKKASGTANTTSEFRGHHGRKKYTVDVFSFFLCIFVLLGFSALVVCLGSYVAKWMGVTFETSKLVQNKKNEYEFLPLSQGKAENVHQDQSTGKQVAVTGCTTQVTFQTAFPSVQTVLSQPSDFTSTSQADHTYRDVPRLVKKKGSAQCMEPKNKPLTPRDEHNCKTVIPDDPAGKLAAASSCENCSLEVKN